MENNDKFEKGRYALLGITGWHLRKILKNRIVEVVYATMDDFGSVIFESDPIEEFGDFDKNALYILKEYKKENLAVNNKRTWTKSGLSILGITGLIDILSNEEIESCADKSDSELVEFIVSRFSDCIGFEVGDDNGVMKFAALHRVVDKSKTFSDKTVEIMKTREERDRLEAEIQRLTKKKHDLTLKLNKLQNQQNYRERQIKK